MWGNKYKAKRVSFDNKNFASKLEASVYAYLKAMEDNGEITGLQCQSRVYLLRDPDIYYIPDFVFYNGAKFIYAEAKGFETDVWKIKRKLWEHFGPSELWVFKGSAKSFKITEKIRGGDDKSTSSDRGQSEY